ncbi:MAG: prolyl oligopeptidase family serine peptidase [Clostridia bacterium]|nr:prolyl oligopeptidase family serine peptidase [Clostridia bacterium]
MNQEIRQFEEISYIIRYPGDYDPAKRWPVIIFLHGMGSRSQDIHRLQGNPFFTVTEKHPHFPFVVIAPQCSAGTWVDIYQSLKKLVQHVASAAYTDPERVYLMGASMGGYGVWQLAMSMPDLFAAICPICGGGMYANAAQLKHVPVWAFHGQKDTTVLPEESEKMVNAVNRFGGNAILTIYPENGHDAWSDTYSNEAVFRWMLSHKKDAGSAECTL